MKKLLSIVLLSIVLLSIVLLSCDNKIYDNIDVPSNQYDTTRNDVSINILPNSFVCESKVFTFGTDFELYDKSDKYLGIVKEKILSFGRTFEYRDVNDKLIAKANQEVFSFTTKINIKDEKGQLIGIVQQELIESMFSFYSIYSIYDANNNKIATSKKIKLFSEDVQINGVTGNVHLDQRVFSLFDKWDIDFIGNIDKRLVVFIPAFVNAVQSDKEEN